MDPLAHRLRTEATKALWIKQGQRMVVSLSGGADSTALACILSAWQPKLGLELYLVHFNHQIREESAAEQRFCEELADKLGLDLECFSPEERMPNLGMQDAARQWRRRVLTEVADRREAEYIVLAHHQDDLAETMLWRILRGTSVLGLSPMVPLEGRWFRPLLGERKQVLIQYLQRIGQGWMEDQSNQKNDYLRNRIRNQLVPLLDELAGTDISPKLAKLSEESLGLTEYFNQLVPPSLWQSPALKFKDLLGLPKVYALELVHQFLLFQGCEGINQGQLHTVLDLVNQGKGGWQVSLSSNKIAKGAKGLVQVEFDG